MNEDFKILIDGIDHFYSLIREIYKQELETFKFMATINSTTILILFAFYERIFRPLPAGHILAPIVLFSISLGISVFNIVSINKCYNELTRYQASFSAIILTDDFDRQIRDQRVREMKEIFDNTKIFRKGPYLFYLFGMFLFILLVSINLFI